MVSSLQYGRIRNSIDHVIKEMYIRQLQDEKWEGVFKSLYVNPVENTEIEVLCTKHP